MNNCMYMIWHITNIIAIGYFKKRYPFIAGKSYKVCGKIFGVLIFYRHLLPDQFFVSTNVNSHTRRGFAVNVL